MKSLILIAMLLMLDCANSLNCRGPYTSYNNKCIWVNRLDKMHHKKTYSEASTTCLITFPMGTLARRSLIDNEKDMKFISKFGMGQSLWIRDDKKPEVGKCAYTDGKTFEFSPCNATYGFVCID
ncbi:C-type lectin-like protein [Fowlpox virus]|nr:C-type lectin-like protein [Fowlpox virus]AXY04706.1 C-type lectin-like protein [Fowlpox virus]AXY04962.1 C-type lectin-like protein [Fowlpox virus]AXY05221.1 C-type lectin-like protein [Fowlpox virus]